MGVQREYKDRLFIFIFGSEEHKDWTLDLYNAINGTDYRDPGEIQFNTIKEILYVGMHNDVSFIIGNEMSLYDQQSSFNPNMPLRLLQHSGQLYEKYILENEFNKYGKSLIMLPVPKLVVFYNGLDDKEDEVELRLSDAFPAGSDSDIEVRVRMINVNYGKNKKVLDACKPLREYAWLINEIRTNKEAGMKIEGAVDKAVSDMPNDFVIKPLLIANKAEVKDMLLTEYNEAEAMELFKKEGFREGHAEGHEEGREEGENLMAKLMSILFKNGQYDEAERATNDKIIRQELYKKYNLI